MDYYIEVKNVSPIIVLTHKDTRMATELKDTAYELYYKAKMTNKDSIFCLTEKPYLKSDIDDDVKLKVCCPISDIDLEIDKNLYQIEVLPRSLVLTTIHRGDYDDLKPVFEGLFQYIEKNNLTTSTPFRVIFHREKRDWERPDFLIKPVATAKPENEYITEIQIPLLDH